jgi:adenylate cyclase
MSQIVKGHDGVVGKFLGDGLLAFWGVPDALDDHAVRAVRAARDMRRALRELNEQRAQDNLPPTRIGIGIHTGMVAAGMLGGMLQAEYTVIGDAVNVAARLCAEAGPGEVLVSEQFLRVVRDQVSCDYLPELALKGKAQVVQVYRVRELEPQRTSVTAAVSLRPSNL